MIGVGVEPTDWLLGVPGQLDLSFRIARLQQTNGPGSSRRSLALVSRRRTFQSQLAPPRAGSCSNQNLVRGSQPQEYNTRFVPQWVTLPILPLAGQDGRGDHPIQYSLRQFVIIDVNQICII